MTLPFASEENVKTIDFAEGLRLPLAFGSAPIALLAQRGRGKTRTAKRLAESFYRAGIPPIVLDPVGVWWGLRLAADGKRSGLDIPILGGIHGDKPLLPTAGKVIAEALVETRRPCIIDTTGFATQGEQRRFMTDFAETFYRGKMKHPSPCHLFLEEAQEWVPQQPGPDEARMLGAFQRIFGQGRNFGIGATLISLFPQMISKRVLNLAEVLLILGLRGAHERKAVKAWMEDHEVEGADRDKAFALLPHLGFNKADRKDGGALIWVPDMGVFGVHKILPPTTFDSSKTPEPGEKPREASEPRPLDLDDLARAMAATIEEAKANDPRELRAEVARLRAELAKKPHIAAPVSKVERVEVPVVVEADLRRLSDAALAIRDATNELHDKLDQAGAGLQQIASAVARASNAAREVSGGRHASTVAKGHQAGGRPRPAAPLATGPGEDLPKGERTVLTAIAQYPDGCTREQLSVLTGFRKSTRNRYIQYLGAKGYVSSAGERVVAQQSGIAALGSDYEPLPTGAALREHWMKHLPSGEAAIFEIVVAAYPGDVSRDAISAETKLQKSTRNRYIQYLQARELVEAVGPGAVKASDNLFDGGST